MISYPHGLVLLFTILAVCVNTALSLNGSALVPALFVMGDSSVNTKNSSETLLGAGHFPYGIDFDTHQPTGRFSNGRIIIDYLALHLGLPFVPSYMEAVGDIEDVMQGANFASDSANILYSSNKKGNGVSFLQQMQQITHTFQRLEMSIGESKAAEFISSSIFYISIGMDEYMHFYLRNVSGVQEKYSPWVFKEYLADTIKQVVKNLYTRKVRKIVITGLPPIGCSPECIWRSKRENETCVHMINYMIMEFNYKIRYMVQQLKIELPDSKIIFCDTYERSMDIIDNHERYGFKVTTEACCKLLPYKGTLVCLSNKTCKESSNYFWWDQFHTTDAVNAILADDIWSGLHKNICYPTNVKDML